MPPDAPHEGGHHWGHMMPPHVIFVFGKTMHLIRKIIFVLKKK